jgi:phosphoribosylglycinamide formyltransferase-1
MAPKIRLGALISGGGTNLQAIIDGCESGRIDAEVVFVGSDNPDAYGLHRARKKGIATFVVDYKSVLHRIKNEGNRIPLPADFDLEELVRKQKLFSRDTEASIVERYLISRGIAEAELIAAMAARPFDLLVLAGFMRNLSPYFIDRINRDPMHPRIMNIHPSLLPSFPGTDGYGETFRYGCKVGGCTVHFIDYGEDSGPIIGQKAFSIETEDTLESVKQKGLRLEWELYPDCIQMFAEGRLRVVEKSHSIEGGKIYKRMTVDILPG